MYALTGQGCGIALLADSDDPTQWTSQAAFGLQEGVYMILTGPPGDTIQNAVAVMQQAGLDSYSAKLMFGDWLWWSDQVNSTIRLVSPQGFVAGRLANLSPEQSSLNKPDLLRYREPDVRNTRVRSKHILFSGRPCGAVQCGY